ncbi:hypothetical protein F5X96DRAFT_57220 [Biscogniauxia mediterranea]|nr:hypothetical protein F5X96DRAFT_57220 [Biscogniauxia mediterranea]
MAGILGSYSDSTCNTHNALRNISGYACGVTFSFKSSAAPDLLHYAVPALSSCCARAAGSPPVLRIPGNTDCEMQFCVISPVTSTHTYTYYSSHTTSTATSTATSSAPSTWTTEEVRIEPPEELQSCLAFVYEGDVPDDVGDEIASAGNWCVARMYDTELPDDEVRAAVTAEAAPASWSATTSSTRATVSATASTSSAGSSQGRGLRDTRGGGVVEYGAVKVWGLAALVLLGLC